MYKNLLEEITAISGENAKTIADIKWVGFHEESNAGHARNSASMNLKKFILFAKKVEYKKGQAQYQLLDNFVIVGKNWWLETHINGYGERLVFKQAPKKPRTLRNSDSLPRFPCNV